MKKGFLLLAAILLTACTKEQTPLATVTFHLAGVESGEMTKVSSEGVASALSATAPSGPFTLTAVSRTNPLRTYTITTGVPVTMAVDSYSVSGSGRGHEIASITGGTLYDSPLWSASSDVEVGSDGGSLSVSASYSCIALIIDKSVTRELAVMNGSEEAVYTPGGTSEVGVVYAAGNWYYSKPLRVIARPVDTVSREETRYELVFGDYDGMVNVRYGRWYSFTPGEVATASGSLGVEFAGWIQGN